MSLVKRVRKSVKQNQGDIGAEPNYQKAKQFQDKMKRAGLIRKRDYDIAPPDTIGKRAYSTKSASSYHVSRPK